MFRFNCRGLFFGSCFLCFSSMVHAEIPVTGIWLPIGPEGGNVSRLALDPFGSDLVLADSGTGELLRSDDGGQSWRLIANGLPAGGSKVEPFADPQLQNAFYALTSFTGRLYRSTDGGESWAEVATRYDSGGTALAADPVSPGIIFVGTFGAGVQYTDDGGASWSRIDGQGGGLAIDSLITDVIVDINDSDTVYVASQSDGVSRGIQNLGQWTFTAHSTGLGSTNAKDLVQGSDGTLVAVAGGRLYRFDEPMSQWILLSAHGDSIVRAALNPAAAQPTVFTVGSNGVGQGLLSGSGSIIAQPDADSRDIVINQSGTLFLASTRGQGVFRSTNGADWTESNRGMHAAQTSTVLVDPGQPDHYLAATNGIGLVQSFDAGATWQVGGVGLEPRRSVTLLTASPHDTQLMFAQQDDDVFISSDRGANWQNLDPGDVLGGSIRGIIPDPVDPDRIYVASFSGGFWVGDISNLAAPVWDPQITGYPVNGANGLVRDNLSGDLYINNFGRGLFRGFQNGLTLEWVELASPVMSNDFGLNIAIDNASDFVYGFNTHGVLQRVDLSMAPAAQQVAHNIPGSPRSIFNASGTVLLVASNLEGDAFYSSDNGETWQPLGSNSPNSEFLQFVQDPHRSNTYLAAGRTRGVLRLLADEIFSDGYE